MTAPALSVRPQEDRPPKVRIRSTAALFEPAILRRAAVAAFAKLDPRVMIRIPVMFVVEIGSVITTVDFFARPDLFVGLVALWLWATVLFANFAEAVAEGRGKAQADALRKARKDTVARRLSDDGTIVLSDQITVQITSSPGETFLDRMIALVEGASRQKTPNEIALDILIAGMTLILLVAVVTLQPMAVYHKAIQSTAALVALFVCLAPTTIGGRHHPRHRDADRPVRADRAGPGDRRLAGRTRVHARTRATLDTAGLTFAGFLVGVIVIVGGLIYFPMLILGPVGERIVG